MTAVFDIKDLPFSRPILEDSIKFVKNLEAKPRCIKTHLPWHMLPRQIQTKEKRPKVCPSVCFTFFHYPILTTSLI